MPSSVDSFVFPRPGDANAITELRLVSVADSVCQTAGAPLDSTTAVWNIQEQYPWLEYIPRAGFVPGSNLVRGPLICQHH